jgi:hypothetical protein
MSWSAFYANKEDFANDVAQPHLTNLSSEAANQWQLARVVAAEILASGKVGAPEKDWTVSLSGHANPNHEPKESWANDTITVTVSQKSHV